MRTAMPELGKFTESAAQDALSSDCFQCLPSLCPWRPCLVLKATVGRGQEEGYLIEPES